MTDEDFQRWLDGAVIAGLAAADKSRDAESNHDTTIYGLADYICQ